MLIIQHDIKLYPQTQAAIGSHSHQEELMTRPYMVERGDLHPVLKLWQDKKRLKFSCLSKAFSGKWDQKFQVVVQWLS